MGDFIDGYTRGMSRVGDGHVAVDAGIMSASDPAAYAGPADGDSYAIPYGDWQSFCDDLGNSDSFAIPSSGDNPPVGAVAGGWGGDGQFETWFRVSGGDVTQALVVFLPEYEEWEDEEQEDCPACGGSGDAADGDGRCGECDGEGSRMVKYDADNAMEGGVRYDGDFTRKAFFEVSSGLMVLSDPCYVLTPDNSGHVESLEAVEAALGGDAVRDMRGLYYCRAARGRWSMSLAMAEGMTGAVLFERA